MPSADFHAITLRVIIMPAAMPALLSHFFAIADAWR